MKTFKFITGREYNGPQVLEITVENKTLDDSGLVEYTVIFRDPSRGIAGRATVYESVCLEDNNRIGKSVLNAYDKGWYEQETFFSN